MVNTICLALITGHATVNYVLMQRRGKLRIKDLKDAVATKNMENEELQSSMGGATGRAFPKCLFHLALSAVCP